jgi:dihydrofolate reductase
MTARLILIAAVARGRAIGRGNALPWHLPEDLKHFRATTLGAPVIMGRRTWDSLPPRFRPLPGRLNIVVTRDRAWQAEGAVAVAGLDEALAAAGDAPRAFVIGGGELYRSALAHADELFLTELELDVPDADVFFPDWRAAGFEEVTRARHHAAPPNAFDFAFVTYHRSRSNAPRGN